MKMGVSPFNLQVLWENTIAVYGTAPQVDAGVFVLLYLLK